MSERPILFSGPMVRAILEGKKTQTRRVIKPQPGPDGLVKMCENGQESMRGVWEDDYGRQYRCPYGVPGDRLWVREAFKVVPATAYARSREDDGSMVTHRVSSDGHEWSVYREGWVRSAPGRWKPSIHMPRWASRVLLEVTDVRVQRVQEISEEDAVAEGIFRRGNGHYASYPSGETVPGWRDPRESFRELWDSINATRGYGWDGNPFVWAVSFKLIEAEGRGE